MTAALLVTGLALSLGRSPDATARLTYDRKKAEAGGSVYAVAEPGQADDEAIRVSEAVVVTSGGPAGHAAVVARRHGVPVLALSRASWSNGVLRVSNPVLGPERRSNGSVLRVVESSKDEALPEGCVVTVDAERGVLRVAPEDEQEEALALAEALRAYEGLKDPQALLNWFSARDGKPGAERLASKLYAEAAARLAQGLASPADAAALSKGLGARAQPAAAARRELMRWPAAAAELEASLSAACSLEAVDALEKDAVARAQGMAALCAAASVKCPGPAASRFAELAAARRDALEKDGPRSLEDAAKAAGASSLPSARVEPALYDRFVEESGLKPLIEEIAQDASLRLAQKSDRIEALFASANVPAAIGEELRRRCFPDGPARVSGEAASIDGVACEGIVAAVKKAWASSWEPGPLGARKRAGGLAPSPVVTVSRQPAAAGTLYSRDPAGGRRRVLVTWGRSEFALTRDGRPLVPGEGLSPAQLKAVARLARALDAYFGAGAQASFAFGPEGRLLLLEAAPLQKSR